VSERNRWVVLGVFLLSSTINYLDRQVLPSLAPQVIAEFKLTKEQFGILHSAMSITYAAGAPLAGMLVDRLGLTRGISLALAVWSAAGILTGLSTTLVGLVACRAVLGLAEAGGIPAAGKAVSLYLRPEERALGSSLNQAFISLGMIAAPPLALTIAAQRDWRTAFVVTGALGLLWIPVWRWTAPDGRATATARHILPIDVLGDRRLWIFAGASAVSMVLYSLWSNWTVLYLVDAAHATLDQAKWFASLPPLFSTLGALGGGWLSYRFMKRGSEAIPARMRVCRSAALVALATAALPWLSGADAAAAGISLSFFAVAAFSANMYAMPLDAFSANRAAFAIAMLTASYGGMQALVSPLIGRVIDRWGYAPVCVGASLTPLAAYLILRGTVARR